jgi:xanthine dehydrogenase molybdopterin-binding subunit B
LSPHHNTLQSDKIEGNCALCVNITITITTIITITITTTGNSKPDLNGTAQFEKAKRFDFSPMAG